MLQKSTGVAKKNIVNLASGSDYSNGLKINSDSTDENSSDLSSVFAS